MFARSAIPHLPRPDKEEGRRDGVTIEGGPGLVDDVEADGAGGLVDVGMVDPVHEADGGALEGVLHGEVHLHIIPPFPSQTQGWMDGDS